MAKNRKTAKELQEMFREGNMIARALNASPNLQVRGEEVGFDLSEFDREMNFLNTTRSDGVHSNVTRDGQRNRSATLLVPDVPMELFSDVGVVYDADASTIRGYMMHDAGTASGYDHTGFYNIEIDKPKFEPILSKKKFMKQYKQYRERTDGTIDEHVP